MCEVNDLASAHPPPEHGQCPGELPVLRQSKRLRLLHRIRPALHQLPQLVELRVDDQHTGH